MKLLVTTLFVVLFLSLAYIGSEYFFSSSHYFTLFATIAIFIGCCFQLFTSKKAIQISTLDILVLAMIIYWFINCLFVSHFPVTSLQCRILGCSFIAYIAARQHINNKCFIPCAIALLLFSGNIQCIWGLLQQFNIIPSYQGKFKVVGSFQNPGQYANYLVCIFPLALSLLLNRQYKNNKIKIISGIFVVLCLITLPFTYARASWIGIIVGTTIITQYNYKWIQTFLVRINKQITIVATILFVSISSIAIAYALYQLKPESVQGRMLIYKITAGICKDNIFKGSGFGTFPRSYNLYQATYFHSGQGSDTEKYLASCNQTAFNEYLQLTSETGLLGLIFICLIAIIIFRHRKGMNTPYSSGAIGTLIAVACCACFSYPFREISIVVIIGFMLLLISKQLNLLQLKTIQTIKWLNRGLLVFMGILSYWSITELHMIQQWKKNVSRTRIEDSIQRN